MTNAQVLRSFYENKIHTERSLFTEGAIKGSVMTECMFFFFKDRAKDDISESVTSIFFFV